MSHTPMAGLLALLLLGSQACVSPGPRPTVPDVTGVWGGDGIRATLTETGGTIEFGCASASIEVPVVPGPDRRFRATGKLYLRAGGPAIFPPPEGLQPRQLDYRGRIDGNQMRLVIVRPKPRLAGEEKRSVYRLEQGRRGHLEVCR